MKRRARPGRRGCGSCAWRRIDTSGPHPRLVVPGIDEAVARAATELALFSELDLPWVRRVRNEKNLGGVGNFRRCTELARSDYWVVLNADAASLR